MFLLFLGEGGMILWMEMSCVNEAIKTYLYRWFTVHTICDIQKNKVYTPQSSGLLTVSTPSRIIHNFDVVELDKFCASEYYSKGRAIQEFVVAPRDTR